MRTKNEAMANDTQLELFDTDLFDWRRCRHCGHKPLAHTNGAVTIDHCLGGELGDVSEACCGHGHPDRAYVVIAPGCNKGWTFTKDLTVPYTRVRGQEAIDYSTSIGVGPATL